MNKEYYNTVLRGLILCKKLLANAPNKLDDDMVNAFALCLDGAVPEERLEACFRRHIRSSQFFPTPADIIGALDLDVKHRATLAWNQIMEALSLKNASYMTWRLDDVNGDAHALAAVNIIGLDRLSQARFDLSEEEKVKSMFERQFAACVATDRRTTEVRGALEITPSEVNKCLRTMQKLNSISSNKEEKDDETREVAKKIFEQQAKALEDKMKM